MTKNRTIFLFTTALLLIFSVINQSCLKSKKPGLPPKVIDVLNMSGIHKPKLARFILESMQTNDSLKLEAAYFIVSNLHRNYTAFYILTDSMGNTYDLKPENFNDFYSIRKYMDSLENSYGRLKYLADSFSIDYASLSPEYLTNNIEFAFKTRYENQLNIDYDFETFKKFILPFRVDNEQIGEFREELNKRFIYNLDTSLSFKQNVLNINNLINTLVEYDARYVKNHKVQNYHQLLKNGKGNLADINVFKVQTFRSLGVAATIDYTPFINDSSGLYSWTTVFAPNGEEINLDIKKGNLFHLLKHNIDKIYRYTYFEDTNSLFAIKNIKENTPPFLGHYNNTDITKFYIKTLNTTVVKSDSNKYFYLAVFNDGKWRPIDWALNNNDTATFTNIGVNGLFMPVVWENDKLRSIGNPFIFENNKKIEFAKQESYESVILERSSHRVKLKAKTKYQLYFWDDNWKPIYSEQNYDGSLKASVPLNSVFLISDGDGLFDERVFTIENGNQIFY